jgi:hypothetical protein
MALEVSGTPYAWLKAVWEAKIIAIAGGGQTEVFSLKVNRQSDGRSSFAGG